MEEKMVEKGQIKEQQTVWKVRSHHTWDADKNNSYNPLPCMVVSVSDAGVEVYNHSWNDTMVVPLDELYLTEELCQEACPQAHEDD